MWLSREGTFVAVPGGTFVAVLGQGDISKHHPRGGHITPKHFWVVPGLLNVCGLQPVPTLPTA